jgi:hypothetical protein
VVRGGWCVVRGAWCVVRGAWCVVRGAWCVVRGAYCVMGCDLNVDVEVVMFVLMLNHLYFKATVI